MAIVLLIVVAAAILALSGFGGSTQQRSKAKDTPNATETSSARKNPADSGHQSGSDAENARGVYIKGGVAGSPNLDEYIEFVDDTQLNALVIDVKDAGSLTYPSQVPLARDIGATTQQIPDLEKLARRLERNDIYSIARLAVFQDDVLPRQRPGLAVKDSATGGPWQTTTGATWSDPYDRRVWEYNVAIAKEVAEAGFDEIQFDYVRFPSDGPMDRISFEEKTFSSDGEAIAAFLKYADKELTPTGVAISADVFGLAAHADGGAGVGQDIPRMAPHLDALSPMVYPSHFPAGSYGLANPNAHPKEVVNTAMAEFEEASKTNPDLILRPWLQDFDYGEPAYGPQDVRAQIQAAGDEGWLLWNASNLYTGEALKTGQ